MSETAVNVQQEVEVNLQTLKQEMQAELHNILAYWLNKMQDEQYDGFYGKRLWDETLVADAPKSAVLNARILWTFSAAYTATAKPEYLAAATRAYYYFIQHFVDSQNGGVYWSVSFDGKPLDTKKQVYAQSFAIYALSAYYQCTKNEAVKKLATQLFELIEKHSRDKVEGGYIEAFTQTWQPIADLRLSEKDANEKKTMNTHLHVLEGYTQLYRIHPADEVKEAIVHLLQMFNEHIIDASNHHLVLFFDEHWNRKGLQQSFGHDIEAAWLLCEAAEAIGDEHWIAKMNALSIKIIAAATEGLDADAGLWHEYDPASKHWIKEKHWWPQAEAMVGFMHAWQITGQSSYITHLQNSWRFIQQHLLDTANGEWIWGIKEDGSPITNEDKAGFWKCPYHNGRACIELIARIN